MFCSFWLHFAELWLSFWPSRVACLETVKLDKETFSSWHQIYTHSLEESAKYFLLTVSFMSVRSQEQVSHRLLRLDVRRENVFEKRFRVKIALTCVGSLQRRCYLLKENLFICICRYILIIFILESRDDHWSYFMLVWHCDSVGNNSLLGKLLCLIYNYKRDFK